MHQQPEKYHSVFIPKKIGKYTKSGYEKIKNFSDDVFFGLRLAENIQNPHAIYDLAACYEVGVDKHVKQSYETAFKMLNNYATNNKEADKFPLIYWTLGNYYCDMNHVAHLKISDEQRLLKAFENYKKAAELDFEQAQYDLALLYYNFSNLIREHEPLKTAFYWLKRAADAGLTSAQYEVALCYRSQKGIPEIDRNNHLKLALKYLLLAKKENHLLAIEEIKSIRKLIKETQGQQIVAVKMEVTEPLQNKSDSLENLPQSTHNLSNKFNVMTKNFELIEASEKEIDDILKHNIDASPNRQISMLFHDVSSTESQALAELEEMNQFSSDFLKKLLETVHGLEEQKKALQLRMEKVINQSTASAPILRQFNFAQSSNNVSNNSNNSNNNNGEHSNTSFPMLFAENILTPALQPPQESAQQKSQGRKRKR